MEKTSTTISFEDFLKVDIRVGTILEAKVFKEARKPAYQLRIDFGNDLGVLKTSAQITDHYYPEDLPGMQVVAVVNFPAKQIANFMSECLLLGAVDDDGKVTLLQTSKKCNDGLSVG